MKRPTRQTPSRRAMQGRATLVLIGFLAIIGLLLFTEHRAHVLGALPWLFVLACPLMHIFMHHGSEHHSEHSDSGTAPKNSTGEPQ